MKKTKLLIPALSIAGLATVVAPMVTMTSCGGKGESKSDWKTITKDDFDEVMDPLYTAFNKEDNLNSFAPSDLVVKYNGEVTTDYKINNTISLDEESGTEFKSKDLQLEYIKPAQTKNESTGDSVDLFYPKDALNQVITMASMYGQVVTSKKGDYYKLYIDANVPEQMATMKNTYIFNSKGYCTYLSINQKFGAKPTNYTFDIEYKSDLHEVNDYTFVCDENKQYRPNKCILQNNKEYKFNVKNSKSKLSSFQLTYYDKEAGEPKPVNLMDGVTVTKASGKAVMSEWNEETGCLEFEEFDEGSEFIIKINKNDLPEGCHYFEAQVGGSEER